MTRRRWIADEVSGDRAFLLGKNAEHLARVLRARVGQQFEVSTAEGVSLGTVVEIQPGRVAFSLTKLEAKQSPTPNVDISLYLAIFKFDRFEWAIEKCTELGVASIIPIIVQRTDSHLAAAAKKRVERWRRIAREAAQQSRRESVPEVRNPERSDKVIAQATGKRIVLSETERTVRLAELISDESSFSLAVGPEGGWTESELTQFVANGWESATLGTTILRAETAAIASVAIAQTVS